MSTPRPHATGRRRQSARRAIAFLLFLGASMARPDDAKTEDVASVPGTVLPEGIASFGAAAADGWLYIYGGHVGRTHSHSIDNLSRSFRRVDLLTQTIWEDLPARVPAQSPALVALDGRVYRIGGLTAKNRIGEDEDLESLAVFERYDPISRRWEELPPLPEPRSSHDAAVLDGKIFVAGGWTLSSSEKTWLETAWKIDPNAARPKWEAVPGPRVPRRAAALASAHGKLWLFGGMTRDGELSKAVEVYDPESKTWTDGPEILGPGFGVAAIGARDALFVSGMDGKVLRLDLEKNAWIEAGALVFPRFFHRLVATPAGDLLAVGGAARGGHLRVTETLRFGAASRSPSVSRFTLPFPGEAKSRQGIFLHGTTLFVAGGNNSLGQHDFEPENFLSNAFQIELGSLEIRAIDPLPATRQSFGTLVIAAESHAAFEHGRRSDPDAAAFAFGGFTHDGEVARSHDDVWRHDLGRGTWEALPVKLGRARTQFGVAHHEGRVWIFGGLDYDPRRGAQSDDFHHVLEVETWSPGEANSTFKPSGHVLPRARRAFGGATLDGRYYLVGGMAEGFELVEECDVFDLESGTWTEIPPPSRPRLSPELIALGGRLYLVGGRSPSDEGDLEPNTTIEIFDPKAASWSVLPIEVPIDVRHMQAVGFRGRILLYSAYRETANAIEIALIDPRTGEADVR